MDFAEFNWWAVLVATVVAFILGGIWYGPLYGKAWMRAIGKTEAELSPSVAPYIISFFTALITTIVLAALVKALGIVSVADGMILGATTGLGFIATAMASDSAFCGWGARLFLIQSGYRVLYSIVIGAILTAWP